MISRYLPCQILGNQKLNLRCQRLAYPTSQVLQCAHDGTQMRRPAAILLGLRNQIMGCSGSSVLNQPNVGAVTSLSPKVVGYITDVEGNWQYFERCVALSSVLQVTHYHIPIHSIQLFYSCVLTVGESATFRARSQG